MDNKKPSFVNKQIERAAYLFLLSSLAVGIFVATILTYFSFLIPKKKKKKDFLFFPYAHKDNSGTIARFQIYLPYFERDGYTYDIDYLYDEKNYMRLFFNYDNRAREYLLFHRIFWRRLFKVLTSGQYKAVFIHRGLFPGYYDQTFPYLERLLRKLNNNITIDFFDAEYARNKALIDSTVSFCDKVCVVNHHLYQYFSKIHKRVYYNNLVVNTTSYIIKENYALHNPIKIFWTGNVENAKNIEKIIPILERINEETPLKLIMICKTNAGYNSSLIEHHTWKEETFFNYLADADLAIYPAWEDTEFSRGKVAYKVLDYVASKVPVIASPLGLTQNLTDKKDVLVASNEAEWEANIRQMIDNNALRKTLADNAYQKLLQYHVADAAYKNFLSILLS